MIKWDHLHTYLISTEAHSRVAGLQLADVCASAFAQAVEPNVYGHCEPRYALALTPRVIASREHVPLYYGVKPVPALGSMRLNQQQKDFFDAWRKSGQAPGP